MLLLHSKLRRCSTEDCWLQNKQKTAFPLSCQETKKHLQFNKSTSPDISGDHGIAHLITFKCIHKCTAWLLRDPTCSVCTKSEVPTLCRFYVVAITWLSIFQVMTAKEVGLPCCEEGESSVGNSRKGQTCGENRMFRKGIATVALGTWGQYEKEQVSVPLHPKGWMQTRAVAKYVSGVEWDGGPREDKVRELRN